MAKKPPESPKSKASRSQRAIPSTMSHGELSKKSHPALTPEVLPSEDSLRKGQEDGEEEFLENVENEDEFNPSDEIENPSQSLLTIAALQAESLDTELGAISRTDPLRRYLEEVRRYPLLEPEEEFRLAMKLKNEGDLDAAKTLVSANLRLVVKIVFEYRSFYNNLLDLIQEGNVGLMKAVSKFDPTRGARLGYYASWWIRSYILKYLLDNFRLVKIGTTQAQKKLFYHLMREKERLEAQGVLAGPKLLAEKLNVRERDVVEMEQRLSGMGAEVSLDAPIKTDEGHASTHIEFLADEHETPDETLAHEELLKLLRNKLPEFQAQLSSKELSVLKDRLLAEDPKTLQEVADHYGLTRERARQIEAKVIQKLREFLGSQEFG